MAAAEADDVWQALKAKRDALVAANNRTKRSDAVEQMVAFLGDVTHARLLHKWRAWGWALLGLYSTVERDVQAFLHIQGIEEDKSMVENVGTKRKRATTAKPKPPKLDYWFKLLMLFEALHARGAQPVLHLDVNGRALLRRLFGYSVAVVVRGHSNDVAFEMIASDIEAVAWRTIRLVLQYRVYCTVLTSRHLNDALEFALPALEMDAVDLRASRDLVMVRIEVIQLALKNYPFDLHDGVPIIAEFLIGWFHYVHPSSKTNWVDHRVLVRDAALIVLDALTNLCKQYHNRIGQLVLTKGVEVLRYVRRTWKLVNYEVHIHHIKFIMQFVALYRYNSGDAFMVEGVNRADIAREMDVLAQVLVDNDELQQVVTNWKPARGSIFSTKVAVMGHAKLGPLIDTGDAAALYLMCAADVVCLHDQLVTAMADPNSSAHQQDKRDEVDVPMNVDNPTDVQSSLFKLWWEHVVETSCRTARQSVQSSAGTRSRSVDDATSGDGSFDPQEESPTILEPSDTQGRSLNAAHLMLLLALLRRHGEFYLTSRVADVMLLLTELGKCLVAKDVGQVQYCVLLVFIQMTSLCSEHRESCGDYLDEPWETIWSSLLRPELPYYRVTGDTSLWDESAGDAVLVLLNNMISASLIPTSMLQYHSTALWKLPALRPVFARIPTAASRTVTSSQASGASIHAVVLLSTLLNFLQLPEQSIDDGSTEMLSPNIGTAIAPVPTRMELLKNVFDNLRQYLLQDEDVETKLILNHPAKEEQTPMIFAAALGAFLRSGDIKDRVYMDAFMPSLLDHLSTLRQHDAGDTPGAELNGYGITFCLREEGLNYMARPALAVSRFNPDGLPAIVENIVAAGASDRAARPSTQGTTFERMKIPFEILCAPTWTTYGDPMRNLADPSRSRLVSISNETRSALRAEITDQFHLLLESMAHKLQKARSDPACFVRLLMSLQRVGLILAILYADQGELSTGKNDPALPTIPLLKEFLEVFEAHFDPAIINYVRSTDVTARFVVRVLMNFHSFILLLQGIDALANRSQTSSVQLDLRILPELRLPIRKLNDAVEECLAMVRGRSSRADSRSMPSRPRAVTDTKHRAQGGSDWHRTGNTADASTELDNEPTDMHQNRELFMIDGTQMTINLWCFRVVLLLKKEVGIQVIQRYAGDMQFTPDFLLAIAAMTSRVPVGESLDVVLRLIDFSTEDAEGDRDTARWRKSFCGALFVAQILEVLALTGQAYERRHASHFEEAPSALIQCARRYLDIGSAHPLRKDMAYLRAAEMKCLEVFLRLSPSEFESFDSAVMEGLVDSALIVRSSSALAIQSLIYMFPEGQAGICKMVLEVLSRRPTLAPTDLYRTNLLCAYVCAYSFEAAIPDVLLFFVHLASDLDSVVPLAVIHRWICAVSDAYGYPNVQRLFDDHIAFLWWRWINGRQIEVTEDPNRQAPVTTLQALRSSMQAFPLSVILGDHHVNERARLQYFGEKMDLILPVNVLAWVMNPATFANKADAFLTIHGYIDLLGGFDRACEDTRYPWVNEHLMADLIAISCVLHGSELVQYQTIARQQLEMAEEMMITSDSRLCGIERLVSKAAWLAVLGVTDPAWLSRDDHEEESSRSPSDEDETRSNSDCVSLWERSLMLIKGTISEFDWKHANLAELLSDFQVMMLRSRHFAPRSQRAVECFRAFVHEVSSHFANSAILQRLVLLICFNAIKQLSDKPGKRVGQTLTTLVRELCETFMKSPDMFGKYLVFVVEEIGDILMACGNGSSSTTATYLSDDDQGNLEWVVFAICNEMGTLGKFALNVTALPVGASGSLDKLDTLIEANRESPTVGDSVKQSSDSSYRSASSSTQYSGEYVKKFIEDECRSELKFYDTHRGVNSFGPDTTSNVYIPSVKKSSSPERVSASMVRLMTISKNIRAMQNSDKLVHPELLRVVGQLAHVLLRFNATNVGNSAISSGRDATVAIADALGDIGAIDSFEFDLSPGVDVRELSRLYKRCFHRGALCEMKPSFVAGMYEQLLGCLCSLLFERRGADADTITMALIALKIILGTNLGATARSQCKDRELKQFLGLFQNLTPSNWSASTVAYLARSDLDQPEFAGLWPLGDTLGFKEWICSVTASLADVTPDPIVRACRHLISKRVDIAVFLFPYAVSSILEVESTEPSAPLDHRVRAARLAINRGIRSILLAACDQGHENTDVGSHQGALDHRRPSLPHEVVQIVIHTINFLRETEKVKFMTSKPKDNNSKRSKANAQTGRPQLFAYKCVVDVNLLDVARAAVSVKMPYSAMQYVEMWLESTNRALLPLSHASLGGSESLNRAQQILMDAYGFDRNIDGIYGVSDGRTFDSLLGTYSQEGKYAMSLPLYDAMLQFPTAAAPRVVGGQAQYVDGMLASLERLGYNHLLEGYMQSVEARSSSQLPSSLDELKCERAWRNLQWDAVMTGALTPTQPEREASSYRHQQMLFRSLKALAHYDFDGLFQVTSEAKVQILESVQLSLGGFEVTRDSYVALSHLQSIREIEAVVQAMRSNDDKIEADNQVNIQTDFKSASASDGGPKSDRKSKLDMSSFFAVWEKKRRQIRNDFDSSESILALEEVLIKIVGDPSSPSVLSKLYLSLAARSRKANRVAVAYKTLMQLDHFNDRNMLSMVDRLEWKMQRAKLLWTQHEGRSAIWTAKQVNEEVSVYLQNQLTQAEKTELLLFQVGVLTVTGKWLAAQRSESSQVIIDDYFQRATSIVEMMDASEMTEQMDRAAKAHMALADYMGEMYQAVLSRVKSPEWLAGKKVAEARARELRACDAMDNLQKAANRAHIIGLTREVKYDKEERGKVEGSVEQFLTGALQNYGKSLALSSKAELAAVFKLVALWFGDQANPIVDGVVKKLVGLVPSYKFVPLSYQIISRIGNGVTDDRSGSRDALSALVLKMCQQHPHHALIQLIALKNGGDVAGRNAAAFRSNVGDTKSKKAGEYLDMLFKTEHQELLESLDALSTLYIQLALFDTEKYHNSDDRKIRLSDVPIQFGESTGRDRLSSFEQLFRELSRRNTSNRRVMPAVLTLPIAPRADLDYSSVVRVNLFESKFSITETGIHRPKILHCIGSNGTRYKQLVKGHDDTRQDLVIEQVFETMNHFLKEDEHTRQRNLRLLTYRVVPLSPAAGVLEWVDNTIPWGSYLTARSSKRAGAHERYHPHEWKHTACRQHLKSHPKKLEAYREIEAHFTPVFHHFFLEKFPDAATWYSRRLAYVRSVAVTSIVGYILGIGDRHSQNILIHEKTAELVHIDFGVVFDQGMALCTPETVPFRLTRDIVDGMGVSGCDGVFTRCCEATLQLLRTKSASVVTILEVFVHDPLYRWMLSPIKALQIQKDDRDGGGGTANTADGTQEDEEMSNDAATRALIRVKQKLEGYEDPNGNALSIEGQVKQLIMAAQNPRNLCSLFPGWAPWL